MERLSLQDAAAIERREAAKVPDGYYAIDGPNELDAVTYWRKKGQELKPWPPKARYGPITEATRDNLPSGRAERDAALRELHTDQILYVAHVAGIIRADLDEARQRFAQLCTRCWCCGRKLTDKQSKVYGIGPECRSEMPDEVLAASARAIGRAHHEQESE